MKQCFGSVGSCASAKLLFWCTGNKYVFHGISQPEVSFKTNAIKTAAKGYRRLTFADGGCIDIDYPIYMMRGIVYTAMPRGECVGTAKFTDHSNRLSCSMEFGKVEGSSNPLLQRPDSMQGMICAHDAPLQGMSPPDAPGQQVALTLQKQIVNQPINQPMHELASQSQVLARVQYRGNMLSVELSKSTSCCMRSRPLKQDAARDMIMCTAAGR